MSIDSCKALNAQIATPESSSNLQGYRHLFKVYSWKCRIFSSEYEKKVCTWKALYHLESWLICSIHTSTNAYIHECSVLFVLWWHLEALIWTLVVQGSLRRGPSCLEEFTVLRKKKKSKFNCSKELCINAKKEWGESIVCCFQIHI